MKVLVVSDQVSDFLYSEALKTHCEGVELVLSCGDLPYPYLEYLVTLLNVPLFYVLGNHDGRYMATQCVTLEAPRGGQNVDERVESVLFGGQELLVGGLEGCMYYGGRQHQYNERQMVRKVWRIAPQLYWNRWRKGRALDVLITHAPPYGIHDGNDPCHRGFRTYLKFIKRYKPRYLIHGHTHPSSGYDGKTYQYRDTTIINVCGYRVLEIDPHA